MIFIDASKQSVLEFFLFCLRHGSLPSHVDVKVWSNGHDLYDYTELFLSGFDHTCKFSVHREFELGGTYRFFFPSNCLIITKCMCEILSHLFIERSECVGVKLVLKWVVAFLGNNLLALHLWWNLVSICNHVASESK